MVGSLRWCRWVGLDFVPAANVPWRWRWQAHQPRREDRSIKLSHISIHLSEFIMFASIYFLKDFGPSHIFSVRLHKLPPACCKVTSSPALLPKTKADHRRVLHRGCNHQSFGKACSFSCYRFATSSSGHVHQVRLCGMPLGNQFWTCSRSDGSCLLFEEDSWTQLNS